MEGTFTKMIVFLLTRFDLRIFQNQGQYSQVIKQYTVLWSVRSYSASALLDVREACLSL